jgi:toxin FitB
VVSWIERAAEDHLFLSAVTFGEMQAGIEITRKQGGAKAVELERWLDRVAESYNALPMDAKCFRRWATLMDR